MSAYDAITNITHGNDVVVPVHVSVLCGLFDNELTPASRADVLEQVCEYLVEFPSGLEPRDSPAAAISFPVVIG